MHVGEKRGIGREGRGHLHEPDLPLQLAVTIGSNPVRQRPLRALLVPPGKEHLVREAARRGGIGPGGRQAREARPGVVEAS